METLEELIELRKIKMSGTPKGQSPANMADLTPSNDIRLLVLQAVKMGGGKLRLVGREKVTVLLSGDLELLEQIKDGLERNYIGQKWDVIKQLELKEI